MELFLDGYNCAQSVFTAFCDLHGMEGKGGSAVEFFLWRRYGTDVEVCRGAQLFMARACCMAMTVLMTRTPRRSTTEESRSWPGAFKERTGTLLCRELLGLEGTGKDSFIPSDRTEAYYQSRPCKELVDWQRPYWMLIWRSIPAEHKLAEHSGGDRPVWQPAWVRPWLVWMLVNRGQ